VSGSGSREPPSNRNVSHRRLDSSHRSSGVRVYHSIHSSAMPYFPESERTRDRCVNPGGHTGRDSRCDGCERLFISIRYEDGIQMSRPRKCQVRGRAHPRIGCIQREGRKKRRLGFQPDTAQRNVNSLERLFSFTVDVQYTNSGMRPEWSGRQGKRKNGDGTARLANHPETLRSPRFATNEQSRGNLLTFQLFNFPTFQLPPPTPPVPPATPSTTCGANRFWGTGPPKR